MINQTITIVNKSGKIVSTSKHLVNVFNEAKSAYNERKAELKAQRKNEAEAREGERKARKLMERLAVDDDELERRSQASRRSSRRGSEDGRSMVRRKPVPSQAKRSRPPMKRGLSDTFYADDALPRRASHAPRPSPLRYGSFASQADDPRVGELTRRNTDGMMKPKRRSSADSIDMDLAYGELPPAGPESKHEDEVELRDKMNYLQLLLDEGNCVQHSVTAMIDNLQKNPDALAAVALTLAEVSNIAAKMAPGALAAMKTSFPAIVALLASPQFMIAAGVGVGVTIIALGGYKIIKKIQARNESREGLIEQGVGPAEIEQERADSPLDEDNTLREISKIEQWRRGIADEQANSMGTSIDGEFITPVATRALIEDGRLTEADLKPLDTATVKSSRSHRKSRSKSTKAKSEVSSSSSRVKNGKSKKAPSVLRSLFKGRSASKKERELEFA
ncbi:hypothetical protein AC578_2096 [Lecanosticta acicola]|uniref:Uncharacterized protein n=1 Tax=Lecanosticta acicola TaxID=111012 RepID=A0AAI8YWN3_9PEZI|nr:hypothetical protein AC578_2096 [Lecanosticta acicola]